MIEHIKPIAFRITYVGEFPAQESSVDMLFTRLDTLVQGVMTPEQVPGADAAITAEAL